MAEREIHRLDRVVRTFLDFTQPLEVSREELTSAYCGDCRRGGRAGRQAAWHFASVQRPTQCGVGRGDRDLLHQALLNIIVNAIEATPAGGEVGVAASVSDGACRLRISYMVRVFLNL